MCDIRLFGTVNDSIVDGPGIRYGIFVQGCMHHCKGCHNPKSHDLNGGYIKSTEVLLQEIKRNTLLDGVTFSGGEPFLQAKALSSLAKKVHELGLNVVTYTGFLYEQLLEDANEENGYLALLEETDLLVDGPFKIEEKSIELNFKGSKNQRLIDVQRSLKERTVILDSRNDERN